MSSPTARDCSKLQRFRRYLLGRPRMIIDLVWQNGQSRVTAYTGSDWAGCARAARITSGGIISIGDHMIKTDRKQQKTVSLSSAEAGC